MTIWMTKLPELPLLGKVADSETKLQLHQRSNCAQERRSVSTRQELAGHQLFSLNWNVYKKSTTSVPRSENRQCKHNRRTLLQRLKTCPTITMSLDGKLLTGCFQSMPSRKQPTSTLTKSRLTRFPQRPKTATSNGPQSKTSST